HASRPMAIGLWPAITVHQICPLVADWPPIDTQSDDATEPGGRLAGRRRGGKGAGGPRPRLITYSDGRHRSAHGAHRLRHGPNQPFHRKTPLRHPRPAERVTSGATRAHDREATHNIFIFIPVTIK